MLWFLIGLVIGVVAFIGIEFIITKRKKKQSDVKKNNTNIKDKNL